MLCTLYTYIYIKVTNQIIKERYDKIKSLVYLMLEMCSVNNNNNVFNIPSFYDYCSHLVVFHFFKISFNNDQ